MQQAWENVESLLSEMLPELLEAGVPESQARMPEYPPEEIKSEHYVAAFDWLHELRIGEAYGAVLAARRLVPSHQWDAYRLHEIDGLQEQILLAKAHKKLRKAWKTDRPSFFGKKKRATNSEADDSEGDQSDELEAGSD